VDLKDIKAIIDLMRKNAISEFELEKEGFKIKLKRGSNGSGSTVCVDESVSSSLSSAAQTPISNPAPLLTTPSSGSPQEIEIKAPMVGTFYRAPAPDAPPYIEIGMDINPESVVCIIEAMKVMNEIKAELRGTITQILVENGKPVEFGQPLFKLRPI
jgi:acetyl-CoA carboxylase biotin carboxyl carrier protein